MQFPAGTPPAILTVAVEGSTIFASITPPNNVFATRIEAFDAKTGAVLWSIPTLSNVAALAAAPNSSLYAGGGAVVNSATLAALDPATGVVNAGFTAVPDSSVESLALQGNVLYVGGVFHHVGAQTRNYVAAVSAATGQVSAWNPEPGNDVRAILPAGHTILLGGSFAVMNAVPRQCFAEVDPVTGEPTSFDLGLNGTPVAMVTDGTTVFMTGGFGQILGTARSYAAGIDIATHQLTAFAPPGSDTLDVHAIAVDSTSVYIGGDWNYLIQGRKFIGIRNLAAFNKSTGAVQTGFHPNPNGAVQSLLALKGNIYAGGQFSNLGSATRMGAGALTPAGATLPFNPNVGQLSGGTVVNLAFDKMSGNIVLAGWFQSVGNQARGNLAQVNATTGAPTSWAPVTNGPIDSVVIDPATGLTYVGGLFTGANSMPRSNAAVFDGLGQLTSTRFDTNGEVHTLLLFGPESGSETLEMGGVFSLVNRSFSLSYASIPIP